MSQRDEANRFVATEMERRRLAEDRGRLAEEKLRTVSSFPAVSLHSFNVGRPISPTPFSVPSLFLFLSWRTP